MSGTVLDARSEKINNASQFAYCLVEPYEIAVCVCE